MLKNILISVVSSIVVVALAVLLYVGLVPRSDTNFAGVTHLSGLEVQEDGLNLADGGDLTLESGSTITSAGLIKADGGQLGSSVNSTSTTATAQTLSVADLLNYDTVLLTPNVGALTLTFPASSTMATLVPAAGDTQEVCFVNATSTAAATITFAAGTGINIITASSTTSIGIPSIQANGMGCFKFVREKATSAKFDIIAAYTRYVTAD